MTTVRKNVKVDSEGRLRDGGISSNDVSGSGASKLRSFGKGMKMVVQESSDPHNSYAITERLKRKLEMRKKNKPEERKREIT